MTILYVLVGILILLCAFIAWKLLQTAKPQDDESQRLLREMVENLRRDLSETKDHLKDKLTDSDKAMRELLRTGQSETSRTIQTQFQQSANIIKQVTEQLTKLEKTNTQVLNFSEQLEDLEKILKQPKGRGLLGEYWLESMLGHVLQPGQYQMQYKFKNGEIVDAVVLFQEKVIPIDSKFPLDKYAALASAENQAERDELDKGFREDLKKRIDETSKYIRPSEGTTDFAFMFLPAEGMFYDLLVNAVGATEVNRRNLVEYAFEKRVVIVSPATFFAYLQTVLQGLKAFKMEASVQDIIKKIEDLGKHLNSYEEYMQKLGKHMGTAVGAYNDAYNEFKKVDKDVVKLTEGKAGGDVQPLLIDKPTSL
jgi:DNA recombination protein RmuC